MEGVIYLKANIYLSDCGSLYSDLTQALNPRVSISGNSFVKKCHRGIRGILKGQYISQ